jgi:hypothetical protein
VRVIEDSPEVLITYLGEGAPFGFPEGDWPTPSGRHPWHANAAWRGHGALMIQRPGEAHAVWHFWTGPERAFAGWYLNLQQPFRRTPIGYDTQDLELDIWVRPDGRWSFKDLELLQQRVHEGRFTQAEADAIRAYGLALGGRLDTAGRWWDESWSSWSPAESWMPVALPLGWEQPPSALPVGDPVG